MNALDALVNRPDWMRQAACRDAPTELFFPDRGAAGGNAAKKICHGCPVRAECLTYAMRNGEKYGVWGGLSERERRRLRNLYNQGLVA